MDLDRRTALALLAAGVVSSRLEAAQQHLHQLGRAAREYKLQFFTAREHELIDAVAEMIIPADEHSPGARDAKVGYYIDLVVANSAPETQSNWKARLLAFDNSAQQRQGGPFLSLDAGRRAAALNLVAQNEAKPDTPAEQFFLDMKKMTIAGYYTTEIGLLKDLGYKGNAVLAEFPGCKHAAGTHK